MALLPAIAAALIALALLLGDQGLQCDHVVRRDADALAGVARVCIALLLVQAVIAAGLSWLFPAWHPLFTALATILSSALPVAVLQARPRAGARFPPLFCALVCASLMTLAAALFSGTLPITATLHWLLSGCGLALVFSIGLPAQVALLVQLESDDAPARMHGLPTRVLGSLVLALALAGMLSSW